MDKSKRLLTIINKEVGGNVKLFSEKIGLTRPDRIYNVLNGNNGLSDKLAKIICDKFPSYSLPWLLTGVVSMNPESRQQALDLVKEINILVDKLTKITILLKNK